MEEATHGQAKLTRLISALTRHLGMSYTVLLVPSKSIRISVAHPDWKQVNRRKIDDRMLRRLFPTYATLLQLPELPAQAAGPQGPYQVLLASVRDVAGEPVGMLATFCAVNRRPMTARDARLVTYVARRARSVIEQSYDPLTGLMSSADFTSIIDSASEEIDNEDDRHCIVYFDIDQLQLVNDTFDQRAGDDVLLRFAKLLQSTAPSGSTVARISGDNFAVLLRFRDFAAGMKFAERVRRETQSMVYLRGDKSLQISTSAGVAAFSGGDGVADNPVVAARIACTKAKDHGGDRVEGFDDDDKSIIRRVDNMQLVSFLQTALKGDHFSLDAQPIVPLGDVEEPPHFEVLVRMKGRGGDVMLPHQFFSAAENYQLMPKLDRWVLERFFETLEKFEGRASVAEACFSLNLSGQSLGDPSFHEFARSLIARHPSVAQRLWFEITETAAVANRELAVQFILTMKELGCKFALDDFGAGLSSFAYLRDFAVDVLKIDGSFVADIDRNRVSESMVAAVTQVAKVMNLRTVAEYVEAEPIRAKLREIGVDYGQGYLLGRPCPLVEQLDRLPARDTDKIVDFRGRVEARESSGNN